MSHRMSRAIRFSVLSLSVLAASVRTHAEELTGRWKLEHSVVVDGGLTDEIDAGYEFDFDQNKVRYGGSEYADLFIEFPKTGNIFGRDTFVVELRDSKGYSYVGRYQSYRLDVGRSLKKGRPSVVPKRIKGHWYKKDGSQYGTFTLSQGDIPEEPHVPFFSAAVAFQRSNKKTRIFMFKGDKVSEFTYRPSPDDELLVQITRWQSLTQWVDGNIPTGFWRVDAAFSYLGIMYLMDGNSKQIIEVTEGGDKKLSARTSRFEIPRQLPWGFADAGFANQREGLITLFRFEQLAIAKVDDDVRTRSILGGGPMRTSDVIEEQNPQLRDFSERIDATFRDDDGENKWIYVFSGKKCVAGKLFPKEMKGGKPTFGFDYKWPEPKNGKLEALGDVDKLINWKQ